MYLEKAQNLRLIFALSGWVYVRELLHALLHLGLVLWPLAWMAFVRLPTCVLAGASAVMAVLSGFCLLQAGALPNTVGYLRHDLCAGAHGSDRTLGPFLPAGTGAPKAITIQIRGQHFLDCLDIDRLLADAIGFLKCVPGIMMTWSRVGMRLGR